MCYSHSCLNNISVFSLYELTASRFDGTGMPKHASLCITYNTIRCTACLYETFFVFEYLQLTKWITGRWLFFSFDEETEFFLFL